MKTFLIINDQELKGAVSRMASPIWGLVIVDSATEAELILCDHWIEPADTTKKYAYFGVPAAQYILPKWGRVNYPENIPGYSNAYYMGIAECLSTIPAMVLSFQKVEVPELRRVVVIVDDDEKNLSMAKEAFPDAVCFNRPESAISFIQNGTAEIVAVLTDLVMPIRPVTNYGRKWTDDESGKMPSGILVYMAAKAKGIPIAFLTAGHQASPLEEYFIYTFAEVEGIPMVRASYPKMVDAWKQAYELLGIKA